MARAFWNGADLADGQCTVTVDRDRCVQPELVRTDYVPRERRARRVPVESNYDSLRRGSGAECCLPRSIPILALPQFRGHIVFRRKAVRLDP